MYKINYLDSAIEDLDDIFEYISKDNDHYAIKVVLHLRKTVNLLSDFPYIWTNIGGELLRIVDIKYKYNIIYKTNSKIVSIIAIYKSRR